MTKILNITEAASLALHTSVLLTENTDKLISIKDITAKIPASEAHLSKVLQRLGKVGIVKSLRGPKGGFVLNKSPEEISLLDVYEAIDGSVRLENCLFNTKVCSGNSCILNTILKDINDKMYETLSKTKLSDLVDLYKKD